MSNSQPESSARSSDPMMQPCRRGCGELVHLENDGFHVCRELRTSKTVDNPWREFIENVISGKNYFRVSEYHELLTDLDRLYALEEKHATQTAVVHMGIDDQPHDGRRIDCVKCHSDETRARSLSATERLHNLCDALAEDADESPFTREEWNAVDKQTVRLQNALRGLIDAVRNLEIDKGPWDSFVAKPLESAYRALRHEDPLTGGELKALPPQCSCDPNPSIGGSPPCPVHDRPESEE